jgi:hypothetical protein
MAMTWALVLTDSRPEAWLEQVRRQKHRLCDQPAPASKIIAERADALQWAHATAAKATASGLTRALKRGFGLHRLTTKSLFHGSFLGRFTAGGRTPSIALPTASKKGERPR